MKPVRNVMLFVDNILQMLSLARCQIKPQGVAIRQVVLSSFPKVQYIVLYFKRRSNLGLRNSCYLCFYMYSFRYREKDIKTKCKGLHYLEALRQ